VTAELWVCHLGVVDYREAFELQERLRTARQEDELPDVLLTLQHPPVYTRGRRSVPGELPLGEEWYAARGIEIVETDRGGKVTYHGPGQLVGYPIVRVVAALAEEGVAARSRPREGHRFAGVWVEDRKIASVGVHLSRGVSKHGFAVNIDNDLEPFSWIVPCGLDGVQMTSLAVETARVSGGMNCFRRRASYQLARALGRRQRLVSRERLETRVPVA
jgi:lipoate-protein ligase B